MISHDNAVPHAFHTARTLRLTPDDRVLHALPAAGAWGGVNVPLSTWSHAATLVLMDAFDPLRALSLIERERCTILNAVDAMARRLLDHPDLDRYDRSSLRAGAFAALGGGGHGLFDEFADRFGIPGLSQPYGATEINAMALAHDPDEPRARRAEPGGAPPPGLEVRIAHPETGIVCAPGEEGEMQFRGRSVTRGYHGPPDETAAAFTADGWFRTGDLGVRDDDDRTIFKRRLRQHRRISEVMGASR
jgi:fatty-acyl-CoA synthase